MKTFKIFVINPGSTSTKVAYYENDKEVAAQKLTHSSEDLAHFATVNDQYDMRKTCVRDYFRSLGVTFDVIACRGGGGPAIRGGGYAITARMAEECKKAPWQHASNLGVRIARELCEEYGIPGYIYDAAGSDDFNEFAKLSGHPDFPTLRGAGHPLNERYVCRQVAEKLGRKYEEMNFVTTHLGGGITVCAHQRGDIVDTLIDAFSPERTGTLPMIAFTQACYSGKYTLNEMTKLQMGRGGLVAYLGTNDALEVENRALAGDEKAKLYYDAMIYQVAREMGAMAAVLKGEVDRVVITGEIARSRYLTAELAKYVRFIAPVEVVPGAFEMEALVGGVLRIARGEERAKDYDREIELDTRS